MYIYKLCVRIIRQSWKPIVIYGLVFLCFAIMVNQNLLSSTKIEKDKIPVLLINEGQDTLLTNAFREYMAKSVTYVRTPPGQYELKKGMFYDGIKCVIRLPEQLTDDYRANRPLKISRYQLIESDETVRVDLLINQFIQGYEECQKEGKSLEEAVEVCRECFEKSINITYIGEEATEHQKYGIYGNYLAYVLLASIMSFSVTLLYDLKQEKIRKRNEVAPIPINIVYRQAALAVCCSALILGLFYVGVGSFLAKLNVYNKPAILISINIVVYATFCASISVLMGACIQSTRGIESWEQVIAVGSCFLSGVFVEQNRLPETISTISSYLPTFWFVKINNELGELSHIRFHDLQTFLIEEAIILCYTIIIFVITFIIVERKVKVSE